MSLDFDSTMVLLTLALGAYVQAVTGFAMGLVAVGMVAIAGWASVAVVAAVVSVATFFNVATALSGRLEQVSWGDSGSMSAGMIPALVAGVTLLEFMSRELAELLHDILAATILAGGVLLTLRPQPRATAAGRWSTMAVGTLGGLLTGLFATGGPPVVYHMYRQPYTVASIRATLLTTFGIACVVRLGLLAIRGDLTYEVLSLSGLSIPVIVGATVGARHFPPPLSDRTIRRLAFALLVVLGATLLLL